MSTLPEPLLEPGPSPTPDPSGGLTCSLCPEASPSLCLTVPILCLSPSRELEQAQTEHSFRCHFEDKNENQPTKTKRLSEANTFDEFVILQINYSMNWLLVTDCRRDWGSEVKARLGSVSAWTLRARTTRQNPPLLYLSDFLGMRRSWVWARKTWNLPRFRSHSIL